MANTDDEVSLVIRTGGSVEVAPGDVRDAGYFRSIDGPHLNDKGQFTFMIQFLDGTQGVLRAQLVPEPASLILLALGAFCAAASRPSQVNR
jgi:hypothetical protein